jgi:hypothetical protein
MSNIVKHQGAQISSLDDLARFAKMSYESGMFRDIKAVTQAAVKAQVAMELGISPMLGLTAIHIVEGRPTLSAQMLAALMKRAGYSWRIVTHTDAECRLEIRYSGESLGESGFTVEEAKAAGLLGKANWTKHRRDMLFARAISRAARWFAPEVALGVYTPDEMGEIEEDLPESPAPVEAVEVETETVSEVQQFRRELAALAETPSGREVMRIAAEKVEPEYVPALDEDEEMPLPPSSEIRQLNPRATQVKRIHARLREVGLDHDQLKAMLPETWSFKTASESELDCLESLIAARSTDELRHRWGFLVKNGLEGGLEQVKDHMKGRLA